MRKMPIVVVALAGCSTYESECKQFFPSGSSVSFHECVANAREQDQQRFAAFLNALNGAANAYSPQNQSTYQYQQPIQSYQPAPTYQAPQQQWQPMAAPPPRYTNPIANGFGVQHVPVCSFQNFGGGTYVGNCR